jgi:hypothetical protein
LVDVKGFEDVLMVDAHEGLFFALEEVAGHFVVDFLHVYYLDGDFLFQLGVNT